MQKIQILLTKNRIKNYWETLLNLVKIRQIRQHLVNLTNKSEQALTKIFQITTQKQYKHKEKLQMKVKNLWILKSII